MWLCKVSFSHRLLEKLLKFLLVAQKFFISTRTHQRRTFNFKSIFSDFLSHFCDDFRENDSSNDDEHRSSPMECREVVLKVQNRVKKRRKFPQGDDERDSQRRSLSRESIDATDAQKVSEEISHQINQQNWN